MPPTHISGTSRALFRVFVLPTLRAPTSIPLLYAPAFASPSQATRPPSIISHTTIRTKVWKRDTQRHALTDHYTLDTAIQAERINYVDHDGKYYPDISINDALDETDRKKYYLVQMTPGRVNEYGELDPKSLPTCRVISKMDLRAQHQKKMDIERRKAKGLGAGPAPKNLELNWAIAGGDLQHRLGRLREFLMQGRKVEILLGPKKKGRKATEQEASSVLKAVRDAVAECKGAGEIKSEGAVGGVLTVVFEGRKMEEKKAEQPKADDTKIDESKAEE